MKKISNVEFAEMTAEEFASVKTIRENRCAINDFDEARDEFYSDAQWKEFGSRSRTLARMFKEKNGWAKYCPAIVFEYNGDYYLGDGQGRRNAMKLLNRNKNTNVRIKTVPVIIYHMDKYDKVVDAVVDINSMNKNWKKVDMIRAEAIKNGNTNFLKLQNEIATRLDVTTSLATYILIGYKATHRDSKGNTPYHYYESVVRGIEALQKIYPDTRRFHNDSHIRTFVPYLKFVCDLAAQNASDVDLAVTCAVKAIKDYLETKSDNAVDIFFKGHFTSVKANFIDHFNGVGGNMKKSPFGKNKILLGAFEKFKMSVKRA